MRTADEEDHGVTRNRFRFFVTMTPRPTMHSPPSTEDDVILIR